MKMEDSFEIEKIEKSRGEIRFHAEKIRKQVGKENIFYSRKFKNHTLMGFSNINRESNHAMLWIGTPENYNESVKKPLSLDDAYVSRILSYLLYEAFVQRKFHKISIIVNSHDIVMNKIVGNHQFKREGVLRDYYNNSEYVDGILYSILQHEFFEHSIGLVSFLTGYLLIQTTFDTVYSISVIKKGECIPGFIDSSFEFYDYISKDGKILQPLDKHLLYKTSNAYPCLVDAIQQITEYINGTRTIFNMNFEYSDATEFQKNVWHATIQIPYGQTRSYEEIAHLIKPNGSDSELRLLSRAVGTALGKNAIMIAIPCHRVIGKDGKLKGFAGGLEVKDYLLSHEMMFIK